jgi:hypothetical protein
MATPIGTLGTIPTLTVGGRVFTDLSTLITLVTAIQTANRSGTFRLTNGSSGYPVTASKTLTVSAMSVISTNQVAGNSAGVASFGYADNDVGVNSATALTTPVYYGGSALIGLAPVGEPSFGGEFQYSVKLVVPAGKYPFAVQDGSANILVIHAYGYEA